MIKKLIEQINDWYLTKKTGKNKSQRDWEAWYESNVNYRATRIKDMFKNFKHVIIVDSNKFFQFDPFTWVPTEDAKQYFWPARPLGENCVWRFERVMNCPATAWEWEVNELGGADTVFVATNNDRDAMMIALKYGG
jgi:hypothetical protein